VPGISRDLREEANAIGTDAEQLSRKVKEMDPPTRAAAAVVLATDGAPYPEIARMLGYESAAVAKRAVWKAIGEAGADHDDVTRMRKLQAARLDKLLYSVMRRATKPTDMDHLSYVRVALAILDRQAKLFGLDAATSVVVYTPTGQEIARYAEQVTKLMADARGEIEQDIIDAEVIEEGEDAYAPRAS
jgi:hypothetical protein